MHPNLQRALKAYRPLYLNGLLLDGQYQRPKAAVGANPPPRRGLLVALAGLLHIHPRSRR
jgi:hypothetical protein